MDDINPRDIRPDEWIPASEAFRPKAKPRPEPALDYEVSKAVGFHVRVNDPRVIQKVAEWRRNERNETEHNNNYLGDPKKVEELRKALR